MMSQTTPKSTQFKCAVCKTTLLNAKEFVAHTKTHQTPEPPCRCGFQIPCPGGTHTPGCLVLHLAKCPKHDK